MFSKMQKRSVTGLLQQADKDLGEEEEETPEDKRIPERFTAALERTSIGEYPAFMSPPPEKRAAWRGTLIHRFLSLIDLEVLRNAGECMEETLARMKEDMIARNIFTKDEGAVVNPKDAAAWLRSPLGVRMLAGWDVHREWGFNLRKPERDLLVQGIIDCAFREREGWVIVDYKTDHVTDEQNFIEIYRPQLRWYAEAVRRLTGRPVKEAWLYSISKQKAYLTDAWEEKNVFRED
jgi:ATP-dependent helicase/nuclease subunit A